MAGRTIQPRNQRAAAGVNRRVVAGVSFFSKPQLTTLCLRCVRFRLLLAFCGRSETFRDLVLIWWMSVGFVTWRNHMKNAMPEKIVVI
jgi:hypothetical protein